MLAAGLVAVMAYGAPALARAPAAAPGAAAFNQGKGPVGWGTFRHLEQLPSVPAGVATHQFASTDPTGRNHDFNHTLGRAADGSFILARASGPGEIDTIWSTMHQGDVTATGNITVTLDGRVVLNAPEQAVVNGALGPPFTFPLVANANQSSGGVFIDVPMPFRSSMTIVTTNDPHYYHVDYRSFVDAAGVSTFNPADPARDVISKLATAGTQDPKGPRPGQRVTATPMLALPGTTEVVATLAGPARINGLRLTIPQLLSPTPATPAAADDVLARVRLRISFDGRQTVDAPLGQFFGTAMGEAPVRALMMAVNPQTGTLSSWWPMPFARSATVSLDNGSGQLLAGGTAQLTTSPAPQETQALGFGGRDGYFHATANARATVNGQDYRFLQTAGSGKFVGVTQFMQGLAGPPNHYLEGNERAYVDGSATPQINGTGTEDFNQGGWFFNRGPFTDPLNGNPADRFGGACPFVCTAAYRLMLAEAVPFSTSLDFGIQHGPIDNVPGNYASTAYWYGRPPSPLFGTLLGPLLP